MWMLDYFFNRGFNAVQCKTLLKLTIPRIKLLRSRREIEIKQMRRDIAKLLDAGQEATARIRVEHIIREEKMMVAQETIELFCELITVRLPIVEAQSECPLDLKEAISSVCFAAPRCADLPELLQVQMLFATKYGKEFVSAVTQLIPECGVNRQLVELLSARAPDPDVKLKLLKEIAEEHELDWDPAASETELLKPHEDLLNGPTQFVSGTKLPLPEEKYDTPLLSSLGQAPDKQSDSDTSDFPEVPKALVRPSVRSVSAPEMLSISEVNNQQAKSSDTHESLLHEPKLEPDKVLQEKSVAYTTETPKLPSESGLMKRLFAPSVSAPSPSSATFFVRQSEPPPPLSRTKSEANPGLQDVLAAALAAAETAERVAAAVRAAASLAQFRISELAQEKSEEISDGCFENPFHADAHPSAALDEPHMSHQNSFSSNVSNSPIHHQDYENHIAQKVSSVPSYDDPQEELGFSHSNSDVPGPDIVHHQPQRLVSYSHLFTRQDSELGSGVHSLAENSSSSELVQKKNEDISDGRIENHFHVDDHPPAPLDGPPLFHENSFSDSNCVSNSSTQHRDDENHLAQQVSSLPSYDDPQEELGFSHSYSDILGPDIALHQQRLISTDNESYMSYPNLFRRQDSHLRSGVHSFPDNSRSSELVQNKTEEISNGSIENRFHADDHPSAPLYEPPLFHVNSFSDGNRGSNSPTHHQDHENHLAQQDLSLPSYDDPKEELGFSHSNSEFSGPDTVCHHPQRLISMDAERSLSYLNLFTQQHSDLGSGVHSFAVDSRSRELVQQKSNEISDGGVENHFHADAHPSAALDEPPMFYHSSFRYSSCVSDSPTHRQDSENHLMQQVSSLPSYDDPKEELGLSRSNRDVLGPRIVHQRQMLISLDDGAYLSYPNLFTRQDSDLGSGVHPLADNSLSSHEL